MNLDVQARIMLILTYRQVNVMNEFTKEAVMSNKTIAYSLLCSFILHYFLFLTPYSSPCFKLLDIMHSNYS